MKQLTPEMEAWAMKNDPIYRKKMEVQQSVVQGQHLATDSQGVEDFLKNAELKRQETFKNTPSDVPIPMRAPAYQAPSGIEKFNERIRAMKQSGNPQIQEQAMAMQRTGYKAPDVPAAPKRSSSAQIAIDMGLIPGTKPFIDFVQSHSMKSGTTINMGGDGSKVIPISELKNLARPDGSLYPYGTTAEEAKASGAVVRNDISGGDAGKLAMLETAQAEFENLDKGLFTEDGRIDPKVMYAMAALDTTGGVAGPVIGAFDTDVRERAESVRSAFETGMQAITRTETGAAMAKEEIDNTKQRFLPKTFESDAVKMQKIKAYKYFINNAVQLLDPKNEANKGLSPAEIAQRASDEAFAKAKEDRGSLGDRAKNAANKVKGAVGRVYADIAGSLVKPGDTAQDDSYYYRVNPDGTKSRTPKQRN